MRIRWYVVPILLILLSGCAFAPDGKLYVKYEIGYGDVVDSLTDDNPSTPVPLETGVYYQTDPGTYVCSFSITDYSGTRSGTFTFVATAEDESYVNSKGGIWTRGQDKYYEITLWADPPQIWIWDYPM